MATKAEEKVNRRNVERLLSELSGFRYGESHPDYFKYRETEKELEELERQLLDVPEFRNLKKKVEKLKVAYYGRQNEIRLKASLIRQRYYAGHPFEEVLVALQTLVEEASK